MDRIENMKLVAKEAGQFLLGAQHLSGHEEKLNSKDLVTIADIKSQGIIRDRLKQLFPDTIVLSEEDPEEERQALFEPSFTGFVIDPIDGTYNFKRDMRESAVSIGYIENGEPVAGVIYDPYKDEIFEAVQGKGAKKNGEKIQPSQQSTLEGASITTGNSYDDEAMARNLRRHLGIYEQTGVMPWTNCPGSGVLNIAYVACGRFDAFHHNGLKPWDNAAGFVIAREAGAKVLNLHGQEPAFTTADVLIVAPNIAEQLVAIFAKLPPELLA